MWSRIFMFPLTVWEEWRGVFLRQFTPYGKSSLESFHFVILQTTVPFLLLLCTLFCPLRMTSFSLICKTFYMYNHHLHHKVLSSSSISQKPRCTWSTLFRVSRLSDSEYILYLYLRYTDPTLHFSGPLTSDPVVILSCSIPLSGMGFSIPFGRFNTYQRFSQY